MSKVIDLMGQTFNRLTVISFKGIKDRKAMWRCQCECGNVIVIRAQSLRHGGARSCGCLRAEMSSKGKGQVKDLVGQTFNRLTVVSFGGVKNNQSMWRCKCKCGSFVITRAQSLRSGGTGSCGCLKADIVRIKNIVGQTFNRLTVVSFEGIEKNYAMWKCKCICGTVIVTRGTSLRDGNTGSCGCFNIDRIKEAHAPATLTREDILLRAVWGSMKTRCANPSHPSYPRYGGRGITVCAKWRKSFQAWRDDMGKRPPGWTVERIDNDRGYSPNNCRWATRKEQANNRRPQKPHKDKLVTYNGRTMSMKQWADYVGITHSALHARLKRGWTMEDTLTLPRFRRNLK